MHDEMERISSSENEEDDNPDQERLTKQLGNEVEADKGYLTPQSKRLQDAFVTIKADDAEEGMDTKTMTREQKVGEDVPLEKESTKSSSQRQHCCKQLKSKELVKSLVLTILGWILLAVMLVSRNPLVAAVFVLVYILYVVECCMSSTWKYLRHQDTATVKLLGYKFLSNNYKKNSFIIYFKGLNPFFLSKKKRGPFFNQTFFDELRKTDPVINWDMKSYHYESCYTKPSNAVL
ncbi:hypothetical protein RFI_11954 [Reticulomyxa filosa]|uniref:Uncharacterized protein n=1 Tax=Reticulomyxa filosa TaxID=46433 RepID=X6NH11_RETFI|nr:hypothetical protein RFI_11954 [Reticulomyxa filosa]|eukprot:ETO25188.1 hypothetical protein RFI_11954 [Reticulomyxa filosa]